MPSTRRLELSLQSRLAVTACRIGQCDYANDLRAGSLLPMSIKSGTATPFVRATPHVFKRSKWALALANMKAHANVWP